MSDVRGIGLVDADDLIFRSSQKNTFGRAYPKINEVSFIDYGDVGVISDDWRIVSSSDLSFVV